MGLGSVISAAVIAQFIVVSPPDAYFQFDDISVTDVELLSTLTSYPAQHNVRIRLEKENRVVTVSDKMYQGLLAGRRLQEMERVLDAGTVARPWWLSKELKTDEMVIEYVSNSTSTSTNYGTLLHHRVVELRDYIAKVELLEIEAAVKRGEDQVVSPLIADRVASGELDLTKELDALPNPFFEMTHFTFLTPAEVQAFRRARSEWIARALIESRLDKQAEAKDAAFMLVNATGVLCEHYVGVTVCQ